MLWLIMIIQNDKLKLKQKSIDVLPEEIENLIQTLEKELEISNNSGKPGIGLAAPQINIFKKAAIIRLNDVKINLINAKINHYYDPFIFKDEGCLSFPNDLLNTSRYNEIHVINSVEPYEFIATELLAVAIQHELDHVNGIIMFDRTVSKSKNKVGPNDPCHCGKIDPILNKIKKFKKCCGKK